VLSKAILVLALAAAAVSCDDSTGGQTVRVDGDLSSPSSEDQRYIQLATDAWANKQGLPSADEALAGQQIEVSHLDGETCVSFVMIPPGVGGEPTYCYERGTSNLTRKMDDVE
jgi:hypothetical protein